MKISLTDQHSIEALEKVVSYKNEVLLLLKNQGDLQKVDRIGFQKQNVYAAHRDICNEKIAASMWCPNQRQKYTFNCVSNIFKLHKSE